MNEELKLPEDIEIHLCYSPETEAADKYLALGLADKHDRQHGTKYALEVVSRLMYRDGLAFVEDEMPEEKSWHLRTRQTAHEAFHLARIARAVGPLIGMEVRLFEVLSSKEGQRVMAEIIDPENTVVYDEQSIAEDPSLSEIAKMSWQEEFPIVADRYFKEAKSGMNWVRAVDAMTVPEPEPEEDYS